MAPISPLAPNAGFTRRAWHSIRHNPQLRNPELWLVWMVPTLMVPTLRYLEDRQRDPKDRLKLSLRDFFAYLGGVTLNFSLMPLSAVLYQQFKATRKRAGILSVLTGATASAIYSGVAANKFAGWMNKRIFKNHAPPSALLNSSPLPLAFTQTEFHTPMLGYSSQSQARFNAFSGQSR